MKALALPAASDSASDAEARQAAASHRRVLFRLMQCHLLHRREWQYLSTRHEDGKLHWPIDAYRCNHCERAWETAG
jgi:hypothetical protein